MSQPVFVCRLLQRDCQPSRKRRSQKTPCNKKYALNYVESYIPHPFHPPSLYIVRFVQITVRITTSKVSHSITGNFWRFDLSAALSQSSTTHRKYPEWADENINSRQGNQIGETTVFKNILSNIFSFEENFKKNVLFEETPKVRVAGQG